jgi:hypothetical protein
VEKKPGLTLGELIAGGAAVLFLIFMFLPWAQSSFNDESASAWKIFSGTDIMFLLLLLALIAFTVLAFLSVTLPFRATLVTSHIAIAIFAILLLFIIEDFEFTKIGFWLAFLASLAMAAGAILALIGVGGEISVGGPRAAVGPGPGGPGVGGPPGRYGAGGAPGQYGGAPQAPPGAGAPTQAAPGGGPPPGARPGPTPTPPSTPSPGGPGPGGPPGGETRVAPSPGGGPPGGGPGGPPGGAPPAETRMAPSPGAQAPGGQEPTVMGPSPGGPGDRPSQPTGGGPGGGPGGGGPGAGGQPSPPANWYPDPYGKSRLRYWDGSRWTDQTAE